MNYSQDEIDHMHDDCVPAEWSHRTHNHEGVPGAWLFPDEVRDDD